MEHYSNCSQATALRVDWTNVAYALCHCYHVMLTMEEPDIISLHCFLFQVRWIGRRKQEWVQGSRYVNFHRVLDVERLNFYKYQPATGILAKSPETWNRVEH